MFEMQQFDPGARVGVWTAQPLDQIFDYLAPEGGCQSGDFVEVPLGPRRVIGVVWGPGTGDFDLSKLRRIARVLDCAPMRHELALFLEKVADYTLTPMSAMIRLATRAPGLAEGPALQKIYRLGLHIPAKLNDTRARVIEVLRDYGGLAFTLKELAEMAGVGTGVVKGLVKMGAVIETESPRDVAYPPMTPDLPGKVLSADQAAASDVLKAGIKANTYGTVLLKGVTGSGKTEVYLEAVAACLKAGRQALVLLPEIALTTTFLARFEERFGARPAEWHSGITLTERRRCWRMVGEGGAQVVVGARSALFLPFRNLGLIVVDEEHDPSYKQEDGVMYSARDMAVLRASITGAQVVLASATPSLESWANAQSGKYTRLDLTARYGTAQMPDMGAIDMRTQDLPSNKWISPRLIAEVAARLEKGEQSMLFLNRRGYAPVTICRACGFQIGCDHCDAKMVEHRFQKRLICHQCGDSKPIPDTCPSCAVEGKLAPVGPGVERLAEEVAAAFPDAKLAVLSSDLFHSARALKAAVESIAEGAADIVIGTQIVAKGHNFPHLTLVGVIDADLGLQGSDLRAAERTFQLMRQVAGRAGRAEKPGIALLQSFQPEHPVIRAILSGDDEDFWRAEADDRRAAGMPPFGRLAGIVISGPDLAQTQSLAMDMVRRAGPLRAIGAHVYGPAPAPMARVRGRHRIRLLIKAERGAPLQDALRAWMAQFKVTGQLRVQIDIDPQSFF